MKKVNVIVPQYHSSHCIDDCLYCGFKKSNAVISRSRLSDSEFEKETDLLISWGYRTIEFVYSSDRFFKPDVIAKRIEYVKEYGGKRNIDVRVGLNSEPFDGKGYSLLKSAGLDFFVIWMETYSKEKYAYWHGNKTPKSSFEFRYEAYERAIGSGLTNYGMGVLFGLNDHEEDVNALIDHGKLLEKRYGFPPYIIGIPRIKKAHSVYLNGNLKSVSDEQFLKAIAMYRNAFPKSMLFFNTREQFNLNVNACADNDLFTIDCGTYPGAYLNPSLVKNDLEQFHTQIYDRDKVVSDLYQYDITPQFDW